MQRFLFIASRKVPSWHGLIKASDAGASSKKSEIGDLWAKKPPGLIFLAPIRNRDPKGIALFLISIGSRKQRIVSRTISSRANRWTENHIQKPHISHSAWFNPPQDFHHPDYKVSVLFTLLPASGRNINHHGAIPFAYAIHDLTIFTWIDRANQILRWSIRISNLLLRIRWKEWWQGRIKIWQRGLHLNGADWSDCPIKTIWARQLNFEISLIR